MNKSIRKEYKITTKLFNRLLVGLTIIFFFSFKPSIAQAQQSKKEEQNSKPNIIFIFADDLAWGDLSCYGNERIKTPSLDKLANKGTLFTQFYVAGSVCSPSRAGIMAGQYPARNRVFGHFHEPTNKRRGIPDALDPDLFMLTDILKEAGYTTAHFGKWHLGDISPSEYGVDVFRSSVFTNVSDEPLDFKSAKARPTGTKDILDETMKFIEQQDEKPFYANVWLYDVHATLNPSKEQMDRALEETKWHWPPKGVEYTAVELVYLATLLEMDKQIGLFLDKLEEMGIRDNTLIIFSSDNGPEDYQISNARHSGVGNPGPFRGRKRSIYEGGIRVPFILSWPGNIPAGKINDHSVVNGVDFLPTLAAITGARLPKEQLIDGEDMSDVWMGSDRKRTKELFWEWRFRVHGHTVNRSPMIAIREGDYKLLLNPDDGRVELYNILLDPGEVDNLVAQKPELAKRLSTKAKAWFNDLPESPWDETAGQNSWNWPKQK